jgi:hypothetical protein
LLDHHALQTRGHRLIEAGQVTVHRVKARNDSASEAHEQRIGSEALQAEDPMLAHNEHEVYGPDGEAGRGAFRRSLGYV